MGGKLMKDGKVIGTVTDIQFNGISLGDATPLPQMPKMRQSFRLEMDGASQINLLILWAALLDRSGD